MRYKNSNNYAITKKYFNKLQNYVVVKERDDVFPYPQQSISVN